MVIINEFCDIYTVCPECCGHVVLAEERGERACCQCGLIVVEREIDTKHSGKRSFTQKEKSEKVHSGLPINYLVPDIKLCTYINKFNIKNPELQRAVKIDGQISWKSRNMLIAITELKRIGHNLNVSEHLKEEALKMYKKAYSLNLLKGRSIIGMMAACIYHSCKKNGFPMTYKELYNETALSPIRIKKCYKILVKILYLKTPTLNPIIFVPKCISDLEVSIEIEKLAISILNKFTKKAAICGKNPRGICAAAVYIAAKFKNERISQKAVSQSLNITEVTLRTRYREILSVLEILV